MTESCREHYFGVSDADALQPETIVDMVMPLEDTYWATREMTARDLGGRISRLQASTKK
jgi:hypothetical protein